MKKHYNKHTINQTAVHGPGERLLLSLDTFSRTGGIQQFNRCLQKALCTLQHNQPLTHWSLWDKTTDLQPAYTVAEGTASFSFKGFNRNKWALAKALWQTRGRFDLIIAAHVNLLPMLYLLAKPGQRIWLMAHGVEVWKPLTGLALRGLQRVEQVACVSGYTEQILLANHPLLQGKTVRFSNCIDPLYTAAPILPPSEWNRHWRLDTRRTYILTLARLSSTEQAKGYDQVIAALPALIQQHPDVAYLLAGKWEQAEYTRIRQLADGYGVADRVLMPGFVPADWLPAVYQLAKVFVMPSAKEGFGIVYLEAAWQGCRVVAANAGGAPEALLQGQLGKLITPADKAALTAALHEALAAGPPSPAAIAHQKALVLQHFGFDKMVKRLQNMLNA